jgi:amino-acid N-acetyltransferase
MISAELRVAHDSDQAKVVQLLRENSLPYSDVTLKPPQLFMIYQQGAPLLGVGGLEIYEGVALLRSLCVAEAIRSQGIGKQILTGLLQVAREKLIHHVFLLTTTAPAYFKKFGFVAMNRADVPPPIQASAEFTDLCPGTAQCLSITLKD